jgi:molybdopterin-guanine dinucleotide biosynthesis protein A
MLWLNHLNMPFTAALLSGGESRRMGRDKALISVGWKGSVLPLWKRQLAVLEAVGPSQIIVSGPRKTDYPSSLKVVPDEWSHMGPLGGIATCLRHALLDLLLVLAVDVPRIQPEFLQTLLRQALPDRGVVPILQDRFEPLIAVYPKSALPVALAQLAKNDLALQSFVDELANRHLVISYEISAFEQGQFEKWNTPEDMQPLS